TSRIHNARGMAVVGQRFDAMGKKVGGEINVGLFTETGSQDISAVATLPDGSIVVVYEDWFEDDVDIRAVRSDPTLTEFTRIHIDTPYLVATSGADLTTFADGRFIAACGYWTGSDADRAAAPFAGHGTRDA